MSGRLRSDIFGRLENTELLSDSNADLFTIKSRKKSRKLKNPTFSPTKTGQIVGIQVGIYK